MAVFVAVVEHGSFSKAAAALGLGKSVVSAHVAELESRLGTQLISRSTRALSLTQEGQLFYESSRQMVVAGEDAFSTIESHRTGVSGLIRLTCSYNVGVSFLIAQLTLFGQHHPAISFDIVLEDSVANIIEERFDLAIRVGRLPDTGLFATELCMCRMLVCASPDFISARPEINEPADLVTLPWVTITQLPHPRRLSLLHRHTGQQITLNVHGLVKTHSGIAAREFIRRGAGIGLLPDYAVADDIRSGELVELLPEWREPNDRPISAVFPSRDRLPTRVRALIDFLRESLAQEATAAPAALS